jgi:hypothetical protein
VWYFLIYPNKLYKTIEVDSESGKN